MVHISNGCNSINFEDRITKLSHFDVLKSGPNQAPFLSLIKLKDFWLECREARLEVGK